MIAAESGLSSFFRLSMFCVTAVLLSPAVRSAELPPPPTACGDAMSAYGTQCSLQELVDAGLDFNEAFISSAGWRIFNFQEVLVGTPVGDADRILVTVNDDDPNNPVVTYEAARGAVVVDAVTEIGQYAAAFDIIDITNNIVISGTAIEAEVLADVQAGFQTTCPSAGNPNFEGGTMRVGGTVFTRAGSFVPGSPTQLWFPDLAFPNQDNVTSAPTNLGGAPLPGNAGAQITFFADGQICFDPVNPPVGSVELEAVRMTVSLNGGILPPPVFSGRLSNNSFGSGLTGWGVSEAGGCTVAPGVGTATLDCDGTDLNGAVTLSQVIDTPNQSYDVLFDHKFLTTTGVLTAELIPPAGSGLAPRLLTAVQASTDPPGAYSRERILINEVEWMGLQGATLEVRLVPGSPSGALVTNVGIQGEDFKPAMAEASLNNEVNDVEEELSASVTVAPFLASETLDTTNPALAGVSVSSSATAELLVGGLLDGIIQAKPASRIVLPAQIDDTTDVEANGWAAAGGRHSYMAVPIDPNNPPPPGTLADVSFAWNLTGVLNPGLFIEGFSSERSGGAIVDLLITLTTTNAQIDAFAGSIFAATRDDQPCCYFVGRRDFVNAGGLGEASVMNLGGETVVYVASNRVLSQVVRVPPNSLIQPFYRAVAVAQANQTSHLSPLTIQQFPASTFDQTLDIEVFTTTPGYKIVAVDSAGPPTGNQPPIADAGLDRTAEADSTAGADVTLDGSASTDPDGDALTFTWNGAFGSVMGATPTVTLPLGTHIISLTVDDGNGAAANDTVTITVEDTTAPTIQAPPDVSAVASGPTTVVDLGNPAVDDIADPSPTIEALVEGAVIDPATFGFPAGDTTVTWRATDASGNSATATQTVTVTGTIVVALDIKPGSDPNCFNNNGNGVIPVAILGSDGSAGPAPLDVTQIDVSSLSLEGLTVAIRGRDKLLAGYEDVNGDGLADLVVHLQDADGIFTSGAGTATLTGVLIDGTAITGSDSICVVP